MKPNKNIPTVFLQGQLYDLEIKVGQKITEKLQAVYKCNFSLSETVILPTFERLDTKKKPKTFSIRTDKIISAKAV